ncbi:MAG: Na+/H+ antiporter subunit E [Phycisphaeraceae bacterium]|nr:Na+/H+ antiporter subunit E [Phycisphaeraceae bacterium]
MRLFALIKLAVPVLLVYLALSNNLEWRNIVTGVLLTVLLFLLLRPRVEPISLRQLVISGFSLILYVLVIAWDVFRNGLVVARIVLSPRLPIKPGVIAVDSETRSPLLQALSAHAITISPGEMVMEIDKRGTLYTHCLNLEHSEALAQVAQRSRLALVARVF